MTELVRAASATEARSIGRLNESRLHAGLKEWYAEPGDRTEALVDGYVVDIVRDGLLIEVQTRAFASIRVKLRALLAQHSVRLVYPVPETTWITRVDPDSGMVTSRRRSPRRGQPLDVFDEVVWIPDLMADPGLSLDLVLVEQEEVRCADGRGPWRRHGVSTLDRRLLRVIDVLPCERPGSLARLLPNGLVRPFTNRMLAAEACVALRVARRATYCLRRMGLLVPAGRRGREMLFQEEPPGGQQPPE